MKTKIFATLLMFAGIAFTSCSKESTNTTPPPAPTQLQLTVLDDVGNVASAASVKLYISLSDLVNDKNIVATGTTDANGKVLFTNLSSIKYYCFIEKGCENNYNNSYTTASPLAANFTNTANTIISSTATLQLINNSSNPYHVYVDGTFVFDMNGGTSQAIYYEPTGAHSIRVLEISGYAITPTDETGNVTLSCGDVNTTTFP